MTETGHEQFDVTVAREQFLRELRERVDRAFERRKKVTFTSGGEASERETSLAGQQGVQLKELHGNTRVVMKTNIKAEPNEVRVQNPHDYKDLLKLSFDKILTPIRAEEETEETLRHEFGHHVRAVGEEGVKLQYGVSFLEDKKTGAQGVVPFTNIAGTTRASVLRRFVAGPEDLSSGLSYTDRLRLQKK